MRNDPAESNETVFYLFMDSFWLFNSSKFWFNKYFSLLGTCEHNEAQESTELLIN